MPWSSRTELNSAIQSAGTPAALGPDKLETALLLCRLSLAAYEADNTNVPAVAAFRPEQALVPVPGQVVGFVPSLQYASFATTEFGSQFGIWKVDGLGVVVAFKGTLEAQEMLVDLQTQSSPTTAEQRIIEMHGGMHQAAKRCCTTISSICTRLCCTSQIGSLPLYITGTSKPNTDMLRCLFTLMSLCYNM